MISSLGNAKELLPEPLRRARDDPRLYPLAVVVYLWCLEHLDEHEPREARGWYVAKLLHSRRTTVSLALRLLVDAGYLVRYPPIDANHGPRYSLTPAPILDRSRAA